MNIYEMSKTALYAAGNRAVVAFFAKNSIPLPQFHEGSLNSPNKPHGTYGCGHYQPRRDLIMVDPDACAWPSKGQFRQWSFPRYSADRTPIGVLAHEAGHCIDARFGYPAFKSAAWVKCARTGNKVTSYEPNPSEAFAESARLFILNPLLLKAINAPRHQFFLELGLKPTVELDPVEALRLLGAPETILKAAANKCR